MMPGEGRAVPLVQAPYFYHFRVGSALGTIVSDGTIPLGNPYAAFRHVTREEIDAQLDAHRLPATDPRLEQNILVLRLNGRNILFDTGKGEVDLPGYRTGKLPESLRLAGIDPAAIDAVVMTHAHSDHCGGCMSPSGERRFPNAQYYIAQADYEYWTDETIVPPQYGAWLLAARRNLLPNRSRMHFFRDGEEFLPGVQAVFAPGHSVGHTVFMIHDGGESLCLIGDLAHHPVLLLENPLVEFIYDTDPALSAQSRVRILGRLADERIRTLAYHFAWPGLGHIVRRGHGFHYIPEAMDLEFDPKSL